MAGTIGAHITERELNANPYPIYEKLQLEEPICWVAALNMWFVVKYNHVEEILFDSESFVTSSEKSTIRDTFGPQMLSVEGGLHKKYKTPHRQPFTPKYIRERLERVIEKCASQLIDTFEADGQVELRKAFASRLPIQTMLSVYGLPLDYESDLRSWYDSFERALANFSWDPDIRRTAKENVTKFQDLLQQNIDELATAPDDSLLGTLLQTNAANRLTESEIKHNALIVLFGGISTVEALILNTLWLLIKHPNTFERVRQDQILIPHALEETIRLLSPVQSATRYVTRDMDFHGTRFRRGDVVNCMLGAANRDPDIFEDPNLFDIDRKESKKHLGFVVGPHHCLGSHLAKAEAKIALSQLLSRLRGCGADPQSLVEPQGYEFRQPPSLHLRWKT